LYRLFLTIIMFGTQTRFVVVVAAVLFCAVATLATVDVITANFEETRGKLPNSVLKGKLYYYYDNANNGVNSRLRFEYTLPGPIEVANLYHYGDGAIYSMCTSGCTGLRTSETPSPWYYKDSEKYYTKGEKVGDYYWYTLKVASTTSQVQRILMDGGDSGKSKISKIELNDNRTLVLSNVKHESTNTYSANNAKFIQSSGCPRATCPVYADMVFVLDNSRSLDSTEWGQQIKFVEGVMDEFKFGIDAVAAAVVQFNGNMNGFKECKRNCFESGDRCLENVRYCKDSCKHYGDYVRDECPCSNDYVFANEVLPGEKNCNHFCR